MATSFCPQCAAPRTGTLRYYASCAYDFWGAAAGQPPPTPPPASTTSASPAAPAAPSNQWNAIGQAPAAPKRSWWGHRSLGAKIAIIVVVLLVIASIAAPRGTDETGNAGATTTPRPRASPETSVGPTVAVSLAPTAIPGPAFADILLSGNGDAVPRFSIPDGSAAIADMTHTGSGNFAVFSLAEDGSNNELLVNTIGNYSGTALLDAEDGQHSVAFDVTASGPWTVTIKPLTAARIWDGTTALSGTSVDVIHIDPAISGFATFNITHTGQGNFAVFSYSPDGRELLVNEIGNYSGESLVADGTFLFQVTADGTWSFKPS